MLSNRLVQALGMAVVFAACTDVTAPTKVDRTASPPAGANLYEEEGPQAAPPGAGPEWQAATTLSVVADAGFTGVPTNPDENVPNDTRYYAWGQSVVNYWANEAEASVAIVVKKDGQQYASNDGDISDTHVLPGSYGFTANTNAQVPSVCGYDVQTTARGSAWNMALIQSDWIMWGKKKDSGTKTANQSTCPTGSPGSGAGDPPSGSAGPDCHWVRYYVIYTDGSWDWLGPWDRECEDEMRVRSKGGTLVAGRAASSAAGLSTIATTNAAKTQSQTRETYQVPGRRNVFKVVVRQSLN